METDSGRRDSAQGTPAGKRPATYPEDLEIRLQQDYMRDDERWEAASQIRDWVVLFVIGAIDFLWMLIIFLTEPGIR
jgi:hypothetical protein